MKNVSTEISREKYRYKGGAVVKRKSIWRLSLIVIAFMIINGGCDGGGSDGNGGGRIPDPAVPVYAGEIIRLTNAEREKEGLRELIVDNELMEAAAQRAYEIEEVFDHVRPDGRSWDSVLLEFSVEPFNWWGENILYSTNQNPAHAMNQWMNSEGHRSNILHENFTHIGVGAYVSGNRIYVVQLFVGR